MKRHPSYIAALRSHGLFEPASEGRADTLDTVESKWHSFISKESRKRLAIWAFNLDSCFAVIFNSCPLLTIAELNIDFPCQEVIFDIETAAEYEKLTTSDCSKSSCHPRSPSQFMKILLHNTWIEDSHKYVTVWHLMVIMCALQSLSMSSRYSFLLSETESTILRATHRWEKLWLNLSEGNKPGSPLWQGFVKHTEELCWFVRKLAHLGHPDAPDCRYRRIEPTDNIMDLHDFICRC